MNESTPDYRSLMVKALQEIKTLKKSIKRYEAAESEPIAIIGMSCRFPGGANDPDSYWSLLRDGRDAIDEVPVGRWDSDQFYDLDHEAFGKMYTRNGGFVDDVSGFDAGFFGVSPREAESMDPHQRILLEVCWETLEYANLLPSSLSGSNTGVFIGASSMDHIVNQIGEASLTEVGPYSGSGCALSPIAGRVSYNFGFTGPSLVVDTACSSSLLSLHLAAESLRRKECDMALAGGSHFILHPGYSVAFCKANMLSEDGRCKTFDEKANGYVRGEGCGVVALKRLSDAERDGDTILALFRGSAVNQDGASGGLTVPNGPAQEQVIRKALAKADIDAENISYIEAHGTGTPLGDPIEVGALANVFKQPLQVGSVKTNIGHLEASAGIAAAMKVILSLQHQSIPKHLHFNHPNPLVPWSGSRIKVPTELTPWTKQANEPLVAGISAFGFSGTNVHVIMSDYSETAEKVDKSNKKNNSEQILVLSARHIDALRELAKRWAEGPLANPESGFDLLCAGAAQYRTEFKVRLALVANNADKARELLLKFANYQQRNDQRNEQTDEQTDELIFAEVDEPPSVAFLCTGQGSQYIGMGQALYQDEAVFRDAIDECAELLSNNSDIALLDLLYPESTNADNDLINETGNTQPALFSFEYALARLWQSWGIQPEALIGHSVGEYVAACLAGVFTLADALKLITARARLMQALPKEGVMVAVFSTPEQLEPLLINYTDSLSIAAYNGPRNTVVSGSNESIDSLLNNLDTQGIEYRRLAVSHAFHSPLMQPMLSDFRQVAETIVYQKPQIPLISNVSGDFADTEIACADYWVQHVLSPVHFADGLQKLSDNNYHYMLEIGPAATLVGMAKQTVDEQIVLSPSLSKNQSPRTSMLMALGEYWIKGGEVNWSLLNMKPRRDIQLPMYPFQRREYAANIEIDAAHGNMHGMTSLVHPLLQRCFKSPLVEETLFETVFSRKNQPFIEDHRVFDKLVIAGASHLSLVLSALEFAGLSNNGACSLTDIMFPVALIVPEQGERTVQLSIKPQSDQSSTFRLVSLSGHFDSSDTSDSSDNSEPQLHAKGLVSNLEIAAKVVDIDAIWNRCTEVLPADEVYEVQAKRHIIVGPSYHWLTQLHRGQSEVIARFQVPDILSSVINNYSLHPGLIDSCFGAMVMAQPIDIEDSFIPFSLETLHFYPPKQGFTNISSLVAHAIVRQHDQDKMVGDIHLYTEEGELIAEFLGLEGRRASRKALLTSDEIQAPELYQVDWEKVQPATVSPDLSTDTPQHYLIFSDAGEISEQLISTLKDKGIQVTLALQNNDVKALTKIETEQYALSPTSNSQFKELLNACSLNVSSKIERIVYLWGVSQTPEQFDEQQSACAGALHLLQALGEHQKGSDTYKTSLFMVTQGAQKVFNEERSASPQQSLLWGLGNVASSEHKEWATICLDLDINSTAEQCANNLLASTLSTNEENRLAWRSNNSYCARLITFDAPKKKMPAHIVNPELTYLITGAQGAIGRELASWLIQQGVQHLALIGRSRADDKFIETLRVQGAQPHFYQTDVTDITELAQVIAQIEQTQAPLGGIFHLAGMLDDGLIASQNWSRWQNVLAPKVTGAWNLHQLTKNKSLEVFVSFSSMASLLGTAGQGSYAAANSFLDALAQQRCANGLAGLSVNWGPWADVGMSVQLAEEHHTRMESLGIGQITTRHAFDRLAELLSAEHFAKHFANPGQVGVLAMDWQRYCQSDNSLFLNNLSVTKLDTSIREQLEKASSDERSILLTQVIVSVVSEVLSLPKNEISPRARLFDLGIDSLTALDMKNRLQTILGCQLSSTLIFDYPTIESLTQYLLDEFFPVSAAVAMKQEEQTVIESSPLQQSEEQHSDDLDDMSEDEAEALLLAQLEQMEKQS